MKNSMGHVFDLLCPTTSRIVMACVAASLVGLPAVAMAGQLPTSDKTTKIINGTATSGHAAVGALVANGQQFCTGTLVTDRVVVTAAHCLYGGDSPQGMTFFIGADVNAAGSGKHIAVKSLHVYPHYDDEQVLHDVAALTLAEPAGVEPVALLRQSMTNDWIGRNLTFVGYGVTSAMAMESGKKFEVDIAIKEVWPTAFMYDDKTRNTCSGDSGGPALFALDGRLTLVGVTSYGDDGCSEYGVNNRVDPYAAFIDSVIEGTTFSGTAPDPGEGASGPQFEDGPGSGGSDGDFCQENGWYGDGICDEDCPKADPDCGGDGGGSDPPAGSGGDDGDFCAENGWYGDSVCDDDCPKTDPDCGQQDPNGGGDVSLPDEIPSGSDDEPNTAGTAGNEQTPGSDGDNSGGQLGCSSGSASAADYLPIILACCFMLLTVVRRRRCSSHG